MTIAVYIIDRLNRFSPAETAVAEETIAAKLEQHLADRAKYMRPQTDGGFVPRNMADGSSPSVRENQPNLGHRDGTPGDSNGRGQSVPTKPALSTVPPAIVAWDLTLRCPVCNSIVEGNAKAYHCFACERAGRNKAYPWSDR